jgi:hypothetical protein
VTTFAYSSHTKEAQEALDEEIEFFRDICGYSDEEIERRLGLAPQTLMQRKNRAAKREKMTAIRRQVNEILTRVLTEDGIEKWWDLKIPRLADHTPNEMLKAGDSDAVISLAESYLDTSFS